MSNSEVSSLPKELRKLIKKRTTIKTSVNAINDYVNKFIPAVSSVRQLQLRLSKLIEYMTDLTAVQEAISDFELGYDDDDDRIQFEEFTYTLAANMEDLIAKHGQSETPVSMQSSNDSHISNHEVVRLPTIQPPKFDGKLEEWSSFIDTFNALFHNNRSLNDVQRLHYLKTSVVGSAADIIKNFSITADNYSVAYNELTRQYENKALTIQSHIRSILQTPKATHASAGELRRLHHHVASHVRALNALNQPVQHWDAWLVTVLCGKLDATTAGEWQLLQDNKEMPTYDKIESFLSKRVAAYEAGLISNKYPDERNNRSRHNFNVNSRSLFIRSSNNLHNKCPLCSGFHKIYSCEKFISMSIEERTNTVTKHSLCFNCLNFGHQVKNCRFPACPTCGKKHNSKLHEEPQLHQTTNDSSNQDQTALYTVDANIPKVVKKLNVMLPTAIVNIYDKFGHKHPCRAVLDSGSQMHFITNSLAHKLQLNLEAGLSNIVGVGSMNSSALNICKTTICSRFGDFKESIKLHALPVIVRSLPSQPLKHPLNIPSHIQQQLADPDFHIPGNIDILLGSDLFFNLLDGAKFILSNHISLHKTQLGWIVTGRCLPIASTDTIIKHQSAFSFFVHKSTLKTSEDSRAEEHFQSTFKRNSEGRFVVSLPMSQNPNVLGDSRAMAQRRFFNLEKSLVKNPSLAAQYKSFMHEYLQMDHMELTVEAPTGPTYYLPHHAVFKSDSSTTKVRVVFDGSALSTSGLSLNDILLKGPKLQADILKILWRFRIHNVAITADVAKMYRQVLVTPEDRDLQRILYRSSPEQPLSEYKLKTVTYGTKAASFLSTRCLVQIAEECKDSSSKRIILQDFYVDDLISGGISDDDCLQIYLNLQSVLDSAGFPLRKWCSSSKALMSHIPNAQQDPNFMLQINDEDIVSTLGLRWQPSLDSFRFVIKAWIPPLHITKRSILSDINSIYDPLGLACPVLIKGKIFIQQLWNLKIGWDDKLSEELRSRWVKFYSSLQLLSSLIIPRRAVCEQSAPVLLHGFCDASQEAFGACIYLCSTDSNGITHSHLYTSKSRVAPIRPTTIPRLELSSALLLAELVSEVQAELKILNIQLDPSAIHLWSDSTVTLSWIKSEKLFQAYVSNRLARISDLSTPDQWAHVSTSENPADVITRGICTNVFAQSDIWWKGPAWLSMPTSCWPTNKLTVPEELPELRSMKLILISTSEENSIFDRYSSWIRLIRIIAWLYRFLQNSRAKNNSGSCHTGSLTVSELQHAQTICLKHAQLLHFSEEFNDLQKNRFVSNKSRLKSLNPFIDQDGLIRVGGRIARSNSSQYHKFPIVLPSKHKFTRMIFVYEHLRLLHAGPQALIASLQLKYWPLKGRLIARNIVHKCNICFKFKPTFSFPLMAPLPRERVTIERPFNRSGIDFCGPIFIKSGIRRVAAVKCYVSIFICFVTRAVHLELVTNLTSDAFLAALNRFMSRRGMCEHIYSDNGTNFVGANKILKQYLKITNKNTSVIDELANKGIQWHFIPPATPHFGGLWEAAVKSAKHHLLRSTKGLLLSFEEMNTLLCQVEAILNSRPMTPLSSDPSDHEALTPNHFLLGGPSTLPQTPDVTNIPTNRLRRFELMRAQVQTFWKRWSLEYLPQLQRRGRWISKAPNVQVGDLAILKEDNIPPLQWKLVRIIATHPGADGVVRVATVKLSSGIELRRPVVKLAILPNSDEEDST